MGAAAAAADDAAGGCRLHGVGAHSAWVGAHWMGRRTHSARRAHRAAVLQDDAVGPDLVGARGPVGSPDLAIGALMQDHQTMAAADWLLNPIQSTHALVNKSNKSLGSKGLRDAHLQALRILVSQAQTFLLTGQAPVRHIQTRESHQEQP